MGVRRFLGHYKRLIKRAYRYFQEFRPDIWVAEGALHNEKDIIPVSILCATRKDQRAHILKQLIGTSYREHSVGKAWLWNISKVAESTKCCASFVQVRPEFRKLVERGQWLLLPKWIDTEIDIPLPPSILRNQSVKTDLRNIQKNSLTYDVIYDVTKNKEYFDDFYYNMYVPYIKKRHEDSAFIMSIDAMRENTKGGDLLRVIKNGVPIAGQLIEYHDTGPECKEMGIRDGNKEFVRQGAIGALFHFSFQYLSEKGYVKLGYGGSSPFFNNGSFRYKRKLGMKITGTKDVTFSMNILNNGQSTRAFLRQNPMIIKKDEKPCGLVFLDECASLQDENKLIKLYNKYYVEGLKLLIVIPSGAFSDVLKIPYELSNKIQICNASSVFGWKAV